MRSGELRVVKRCLVIIIALLAVSAVALGIALLVAKPPIAPDAENKAPKQTERVGDAGLPNGDDGVGDGNDAVVEETPEPSLPAIPNPHAVAGTRPEDFGLQVAMELNGQPIERYVRQTPINFGETNEYSSVEGIVTFRGNNFRDSASYGTLGPSIRGRLSIEWQTGLPETIKRVSSDRSWFGSGWTGQPLIVKWDKATLSKMNILDAKKDEEGLTEVILGTEGAAVYFVDLKDGKPTRKKISSPWCLKGAGALDPRGYPLYYVGSGDISAAGPGQNMIFSLTDTKKLYDYGEDDPFKDRNWQAYDASTIVHAATDTVTYAAESNIIYQFTLNTRYDAQAGTIAIDPSDIFKWKYTTERSRAVYSSGKDPDNTKPYLGFESSPVFWREYMYVADNCGNLFCININTFEVVWMSDTQDDTNCSPVFELDEENGRAYIYIGTSARFSRNPKTNIAEIPFWKIDAITGEKVWTADGYGCLRGSDSGGIQDTAALGKNALNDLVFVTYANVANESGRNSGSRLVAYDKATGKEAWKESFSGQCWSSPVCVYDDSGKGYVVYCSASYTNKDGEAVGGFVTLLDGLTGKKLASVEVKGHVESSPAVYNDMLVLGTRGQVLYGIKIS